VAKRRRVGGAPAAAQRPRAPDVARREPGRDPRGAAEVGATRTWWTTAAVIAAVALALYVNSLRGALFFDDTNAIINNVWVRTGDVASILTRPSWWSEARGHGWRPLTTLTFALDHALHGLDPVGYHVVNVLLHATVSVLVFAVFSRVAAPVPAAIAALLFAAHPVHTEAVASVVGRAELLAAGGFFLAWLLFLRADAYRTGSAVILRPDTEASGSASVVGADARRAAVLEALGVATFFVASLAKENALALLPVLVLTDVLQLAAIPRPATRAPDPFARARPGQALRWHCGRYAALAAAALLFVWLRHLVLGDDTAPISVLDNPLVALPPFTRELTAIKVAGLYGWRLLVPWQLAADYSYRQIPPVASVLEPTFLAAFAVVAAVPVLVWWSWRRAPAVAFGLGLLALTFAMVSNLAFLIGTIMAERLIYLPSAGFCLTAAVALERATRRATAGTRAPSRVDIAAGGGAASATPEVVGLDLRRLWRPPIAVPLAIVVALYAARTWSRNVVWRDRIAFFSTMIAEAPDSARSHRELGSVLADHGKFDLARAEFERSLAIKPEDPATLYNLGNALLQERRYDDAIEAYERALAAKPDFADAMVNLGNAESLRGDSEAALASMRRALALSPRSASLHMNVANELFRLARRAEARDEYEAALALEPDAPEILTNYGAFLLTVGDYDAAVRVYRRAGDAPRVLVGLAAAYRAQGRAADARAAYARAAQLFPNDSGVRQLGDVLRRDAATASSPSVGTAAPSGGAAPPPGGGGAMPPGG